MKEIQLSGESPLTKSEIEALSLDLVTPVIEGDVDPIAHVVRLRAIQEAVKKALDDDRLKDITMSEIEKYGRSRNWNGATVTMKETGVRYDFSVCGDPIYDELQRRKKGIETEMKERESFLKSVPDNTTILDESTGEIYTIHPAVRMAAMGYSITFKK